MSDTNEDIRNESKAPGVITLAALWFGASVSLAEIATGGLLAGAGVTGGLLSSFAGHLAGAVFLFMAGWISWKRKKTAIAVCSTAFGNGGPVLFGLLNVLQLAGWTAVMIIIGGRNLHAVTAPYLTTGSELPWRIIPGVLIVVWAGLGPKKIGFLNTIAALSLLILSAVISIRIFSPLLSGNALPHAKQIPGLSFGMGLELSVIMPLSWLPLVGDYMAGVRHGKITAVSSALSYSIGSFWMYAIGMVAVITAGTFDPVSLVSGTQEVIPALAVIILSTVTTAFLDARSAGISLVTAVPRLRENHAVTGCAIAGLLLACFAPVEQYENFLLFIGSVFAPLYAVVFTDYILRPRFADNVPARGITSFVIWAAGVGMYHILQQNPGPAGTTIPVMLIVASAYSLYILGVKIWKQ